MEIIRIPTSYALQMKHLSDSDISYVMKCIFLLSSGDEVEIEDTMRGGIVQSIWRETVQLENKARAKKGEKQLSYQLATLVATPSKKKCDQIKSNQFKSNQTNSNQTTDISKDIGEQALVVVEDFGDKEINNIIQLIKETVESQGFIYKAGKQERNRAKNILTGKDFGATADKANMSRSDFCYNIIIMSTKLDFWNGKINNAETLYTHYARVYNEAVNLKAKKQKDTSLTVF